MMKKSFSIRMSDEEFNLFKDKQFANFEEFLNDDIFKKVGETKEKKTSTIKYNLNLNAQGYIRRAKKPAEKKIEKEQTKKVEILPKITEKRKTNETMLYSLSEAGKEMEEKMERQNKESNIMKDFRFNF